jgi:hypothetical protein
MADGDDSMRISCAGRKRHGGKAPPPRPFSRQIVAACDIALEGEEST